MKGNKNLHVEGFLDENEISRKIIRSRQKITKNLFTQSKKIIVFRRERTSFS